VVRQRWRILIAGLVAAALPAGLALSEGPEPASRLTSEQALARREISELQVAPDGRRVAFTVREPPKGEGRSRHLWVLDLRTREARQFTRSTKSEWAPRWSPDGTRLAFLSDRDEKEQLWVMSADGGEAARLATEEADGDAFEWSPDGTRIAYLAKQPKTEAEEKREKEKEDARVVDRDDRPARLFVVEVEAKKTRLVTPPPWRVKEVQWTPKGDRVIVVATDRPESDLWTDRIVSVSVADGTLTPIAASEGPFEKVRLSPDGRSLAWIGSRDGGPEPHDIFLLPLAADGTAPGERPAARNLTGDAIDRAVDDYAWRPDGSILALVETGFTSRLYAVTQQGRAEVLPALPTMATDLALLGASAAPGSIVLVGERATEAPEVWLWNRGRPAERVTHLNDAWKAIPLAEPEILRYRSFDGTEIEGALVRPAGPEEGAKESAGGGAKERGRRPLVVLAHGGPTGRWEDRFDPWGQLLAARGFAIFYPNVRGSTGYGSRFVGLNRGDWGGGDFKDLMSGVDLLIERGLADPERLGIGGWSYGGFMAMWAVTQTTRFKAAVAGAGLSDLASEFGTEDGPAYDEWFYGLPYEKLDGFTRSSPITYVKNARTPTLILQGEADVIDPIGQSQQFYRALKRYGVPSDFVLYPREGHEIKEEKHLLDRLNRVVAWFEKYLK
jgi:dipeptidyl aminopeptidase/acylaminoacyl peptidase